MQGKLEGPLTQPRGSPAQGMLLHQLSSAHHWAHPGSAERGPATDASTSVLLAPPCRVSPRLVRARLPEPLQV